MKDRLIVVEDEPAQRALVADLLRGAGYVVADVGSAEEALRRIEREDFDLVLSDWKLPVMDGEQLFHEVRRRFPSLAFLFITAYGTIARAVAAVRSGADDYLAKPFERDELLLAVERALRSRRLVDENRRLNEALVEARGERERLVDLVGRSGAIQKVFRHVSRVADSSATVLVTGESGTGKELVARALHALSPRNARPFLPVNCAAIPDGLAESELFGAEKGSYSGADRRRPGRFESAEGGTLFLDEVGELPLDVQPKLLRALQERRIVPVGGNTERAVDVRIVAATNRDLLRDVAEGRFREDLYYRLAVIPVHMPALRDRREDVPLLLDHFLSAACRKHGRPRPRFTSALTRRLFDHPWPGNVRELSNVIERLVLLAGQEPLDIEDLPSDFGPGGATTGNAHGGRFQLDPGGIDWELHERDALVQALEMARGNRAQAAKLLGLNYKAFLYRLEKHGARPGSELGGGPVEATAPGAGSPEAGTSLP
ncbi:MAG: sigma-54 dependent transcriptional regulator [Planctomycetota bacterium]